MKQGKKGLIMGIAVLAVIALVFGGYHIFRYPALFRNLSDRSLDETQTEELREEILSRPDLKILVACFSYSGTTRGIAGAISEKTGGDLFEIIPQDGYSNVYLESNSEIRGNERPALTDTVENMEEYDIVFVGYPVWWHATPAPVNTFLESYDLAGKLIIPFCTSGGSGIDETMPTFLHSCDGLAVYGERRISGTGQLDGWLSELGVTGPGGEKRSEQPEAEGPAAQQTVPEEIQREGTAELLELENLPACTYRQQEIELENQGQKIYGIACIPETENETVPLVICAHGLGGSYQSNAAYAEQLASHGIAAYCFDFRGGGGSRSDGDTTEMSVMTEVSDLEAVMEAASGWEFVDENRIVPLSYSDRAAEVYEDAEYHVIDGAGHGFHGDAFEEAVRYVFAYLQEIRII